MNKFKGIAIEKNWVWAFIISLITVFIANIPILFGYIKTNLEFYYTGTTIASEDNLSYLAKIYQGYQGKWEYNIPYTFIPHEGVKIYLYYLFLGNIARFFNISPIIIFHTARVINGLVLLNTIYFFITQMIDDSHQRRYMFLLTSISSGLGWVLILFNQYYSSDLKIPESNTFFSLMETCHFSLSQALILITFYLLISPNQPLKCVKIYHLITIAIVAILISNIYPFALLIIIGTTGLHVLIERIKRKLWQHEIIIRLLVFTFISIPIGASIYFSVQKNSLFAIWQNQSLTISPPFWAFLSGYGLLILATIPGARWISRKNPALIKILPLWILVTIIGLYSPTTLQRRFSLGLHLPISFLAGFGIMKILEPNSNNKISRLLSRFFLIVTSITSMLLIIVWLASVMGNNNRLFLSYDEIQSISWLQESQLKNQVILSSPQLGVFIPAFSSHRVVIGHEWETPNFKDTNHLVTQFYSPSSTSETRKRLIKEWQVDYIILGPREITFGISSLTEQDGVKSIINFGNVTIYKPIK